jgi:hypothetical protein
MAIKEYVGAIIMEIDGREVEVQDLDVTENTGMIPVKTMNRSRVIAGVARGIMEWSMRVTVVIPFNDDIKWEKIFGATITISPSSPGGKRITYLDCCTQQVGQQYTVNNEARRTLEMFAVRKVEE